MAPPFEATGDVLVAFYSDNLLSSLEYTLACAPAVLDEGRLEALEASAAGLRARKEALAAFGERFTVSFDDYVAKKAALDEAEAVVQRALQDEARTQAEENSAGAHPTLTPSGACWTPRSRNAPRRSASRRLHRRKRVPRLIAAPLPRRDPRSGMSGVRTLFLVKTMTQRPVHRGARLARTAKHSPTLCR